METMKKNKNWKTAIMDGVLIVAVAFGIASCDNSPKPEDTKDTAEEHNDAKFDDNKSENDAQFLVDAAEINLMEIQLGNLAAEKGMTAEVKDMGKMMSEAHSKSLEELTGLAAKKSVTVPTTLTDEGQSSYKKLNDKTGKDFDKDYCDMTVSGHKDAIDRFEKAADNSSDMDIKNWAATALPALRKHLDQAITCQDNYKKM